MTQYEPPLFKSMDGALWFAFNFRHGTIKASHLAQMMGGGGQGRGLGGIDGSAQAGMIRAEVAALGWHEEAKAWGWTEVDDVMRVTDIAGETRAAVLVARFSPTHTDCRCGAPCCQQYKPNPDWAKAVDALCGYIRLSMANTCNSLLLRGLVARYFGLRASFVRLSEECGVKRDTASAHNAVIDAWLSKAEKEARGEIEGRLKAANIIE